MKKQKPKRNNFFVFLVEGINWTIQVNMDKKEFDSKSDFSYLEIATRAADIIHSSPNGNKCFYGMYVKVIPLNIKYSIKLVNSYYTLINSSQQSKANILHSNIYNIKGIEIQKEKLIWQ